VVTFGYRSNTYTALLEDMWGPPCKIRGVKQDLCSSLLINFNWVAFLVFRQALSACSPIFPFNTQVPTLGCFPHLSVAAMLDVLIIRFNGMPMTVLMTRPPDSFDSKIHIYIQHINKPRLVSKLIFFKPFFEFFSRNFKMRGDGNHDDDRHDDNEQV
jgi:hypothetical protein